MQAKIYDVCIIGAGIAGSSLAYNIAGDLDACVIEKNALNEVGNKPCGEGVHKYWFGGGVRPDPWELGAVVQDIKGVMAHFQGESLKVKLDPDREGIMLDRRKFVRKALLSALDRGCEHIRAEARPKFEGRRIDHVVAGEREIRAKIYVDASGTSAVIRSHYVPNRRGMFAIGYRELVKHRLGDESWHAYAFNNREAYWAFPRGSVTNIGYASAESSSIRKKLEKFKQRIGFTGKVIDAGAALIPLHKPIGLVYGNAVAIGDAGFTVNPITGGGIGPSVSVANLLATTLKEGRDLEDFEKEYWTRIGRAYLKFYWLMRFIRSFPAWKYVVKRAIRRFYGEMERCPEARV